MKSIKMILIALVISMTSSWAGPLQEKLDARKNSAKRPEEIKKIMEESLRDLKDSGIEKRLFLKI